jgi:hypothetical protein
VREGFSDVGVRQLALSLQYDYFMTALEGSFVVLDIYNSLDKPS